VTYPRRIMLIGAMLVALLSMAALQSACGSSGTKSYSDPTYGYGFSYPGAWKLQSGATSDATAGGTPAGTVAVYDPNGTVVDKIYADLAMIMVYKLNFTVTDPWAAEVKTELEGLVGQLQGQTTDMKVEQALKQTTIATLKGYVATFTFTKGGTPMRSTLYFLFNESIEYELTLQASVAKWDDTKPALDGVVSTFRPGAAK
jgi:hypothetical protein